jgi:hypothetical protein
MRRRTRQVTDEQIDQLKEDLREPAEWEATWRLRSAPGWQNGQVFKRTR